MGFGFLFVGEEALDEWVMERVMEQLETQCYDRMQEAMKTVEGLGIEYDEDIVCDVCRSVSDLQFIWAISGHLTSFRHFVSSGLLISFRHIISSGHLTSFKHIISSEHLISFRQIISSGHLISFRHISSGHLISFRD